MVSSVERDETAPKVDTFLISNELPEATVRPARGSDTDTPPIPSHPTPAILVMGLTGAGKSTFISSLVDETVEIGHRLGSCTTEVNVYAFRTSSGEKVYLIDTPGFNDSQENDGQLLTKIANFLCTTFSQRCFELLGLIYVHRIIDTRMAGSSIKSLRIFQKICGQSNYNRVTVVTTMWDLLKSTGARSSADDREKDLRAKPEFFGDLLMGGAEMKRNGSNYESANDIVETITRRDSFVITNLQREMLLENTILVDTTVGQFLSGELRQSQERFERELGALGLEYNAALEKQDEGELSFVSGQQREVEKKMEQVAQNWESLVVTAAEMVQVQTEWIKRMLEDEKRARMIESHEKSQRILQLEGQRETMKQEHLRELENIHADKNGEKEALEGQIREYRGQMKALEKQLRQAMDKNDLRQRVPSRQNTQGRFLGKTERGFMMEQVQADDKNENTGRHPKSRLSTRPGSSNSRQSSIDRQSSRMHGKDQYRSHPRIDGSWSQPSESKSDRSTDQHGKQGRRAVISAGAEATRTASEPSSAAYGRHQLVTTEPQGPSEH